MRITAEDIKTAIREHLAGRYKGKKDLFDMQDHGLKQRSLFLLLARGVGISDAEIAKALDYKGGAQSVQDAYRRAKVIYGDHQTFSDDLEQIAAKLGINVPNKEIVNAGYWVPPPPLDYQI